LARANRQLTRSNWSGGDLKEIVCAELTAFKGRIAVEGGSVMLRAQQVQNFTLVLHELVANATKYGALSNGAGQIDVFWDVAREADNNVVKFTWRERGGPDVVAPIRKGFGTSLINAVFPGARFDYAPAGMICAFAAPVSGGPTHSFTSKPEPIAWSRVSRGVPN
jgi:two-component sensor histidine kinase